MNEQKSHKRRQCLHRHMTGMPTGIKEKTNKKKGSKQLKHLHITTLLHQKKT